jgi:hypothetical protein
LKDKIDSIEKKKNEQINNSLRVKKEQSNSEIFKERLGKKSFSLEVGEGITNLDLIEPDD